MKIQTLASTPLEIVVEALLESFQNYFVPLSSDVEFWRKRFSIAQYRPEYSVGVFDEGRLVGFIVHCLGDDLGKYTAFNNGTGVIEAYRGQQLVSKMYEYIIPSLRQLGIEKLKLEVIQQNARAIKAYERVGFKMGKSLDYIKFHLEALEEQPFVAVEKINAADFRKLALPCAYQSWDNRLMALDDYEGIGIYLVKEKNELIGYFVINETRGSIAQIENYGNDWDQIFYAISRINSNILLTNLSTERTDLGEYLRSRQAEWFISQYEMERML